MTSATSLRSTPPPPAHAAGIVSVYPYLNFNGRGREAIAFYQAPLGAEVVELRGFDAIPDSEGCPPLLPDRAGGVMHAELRIGPNRVMLTDGCEPGVPTFEGIALSVALSTATEAEATFQALADGGKIEMPLEKVFFAERFGVVLDRFGVRWLVVALA